MTITPGNVAAGKQAGRGALEPIAEGLHPYSQAGDRESLLGMMWAPETSKPAPSNTILQ